VSDVRPGTRLALERGCLCPVLDNNHGEFPPYYDENGKAQWWFTGGCPVHAPSKAPTSDGTTP
jgi:hypothetical protein